MTNFDFELGDKVKDDITGFEGIVTCRSQWLNMCNTYGVQSQKMKDDKPQERQHFDEPQLKMVKAKVKKQSRKTGGIQKHQSTPNR